MLLGSLLKLLNGFQLLEWGLRRMPTFPTLNARVLGWNASRWPYTFSNFLSSSTIEVRWIPAKLLILRKHVTFILVVDILMKATRRVKVSALLFPELSRVWACRSHRSFSPNTALSINKTTFEKLPHFLVFHGVASLSALGQVIITISNPA